MHGPSSRADKEMKKGISPLTKKRGREIVRAGNLGEKKVR